MTGPKYINRGVFILFIYVIVVGNLGVVGMALILGSFFPHISKAVSYTVLMAAQDIIMLIIPFVIFCIFSNGNKKEILALNRLSAGNFFFCLICVIFLIPVMTVVASVTSLFAPDTTAELTTDLLTATPPVLGFIIMAVCPAVFEELMFRGIIFGSLKKFGTAKAIILSAFFFGLFHMNPYQFPYAFLAGTVFAFVVYVTNSILSSMLMHLAVNGIQVCTFYAFVQEAESAKEAVSAVQSSAYGPQATVDATIASSGIYAVFDFIFVGILFIIMAVLLISVLKGIYSYNKKRGTLPPLVKTNFRFTDIYVILSTVATAVQYIILK